MAVYNGLLLIDKPIGWTSFDVVNYVRKMVAELEGKKPRNTKVGHTGTLDPQATGLLVLCVGGYTKKVPELIKQDKTYGVEITLGKTSTTGDSEGEISEYSSNKPETEDLKRVFSEFIGVIKQTPPSYSAIKVNGKRAYELAREGKEVRLEPREVKINSITEIDYNYPKVSFVTDVGSGTYIRSLAEDIGKKLGSGAYMSALRRTRIGDRSIVDAIEPKKVTLEFLQKTLV